jgi:hypothetical protein
MNKTGCANRGRGIGFLFLSKKFIPSLGQCIMLLIPLWLYGCASERLLEEDNMFLDKKEAVSAQVVLKSASGKSFDDLTEITAENVHDFLPTDEAISMTTKAFMSAGFQVGTVVGNSFSISAEVGHFEKFFNVRLRYQTSGEIMVGRDDGFDSYELPIEDLPASLGDLIEVITFTRPPDFGPTDFGP